GRIAGVYNIACGQSCSILDLVGMINGVLGTDIAPIHRPARAGDIRHSWADISRAREAFGYTPPVGVAEGLETTVAWYKQKEQAV
ncbi:MAG: UDP-glucose 4-epimerase, partial [Candidatus Hydrogenedentes bacterium]|nr:UDP-glucose 4-epimerase [Candidatus Hydrogenedentota bacterium]